MGDRSRVAELLGREPAGAFEVVVRDATGDPVVVRNAPFLDDGTPMPTLYYLVGAELVRDVSRLEAAGGVRAAEAALDPDAIAAVHRRYGAERDAEIADDETTDTDVTAEAPEADAAEAEAEADEADAVDAAADADAGKARSKPTSMGL